MFHLSAYEICFKRKTRGKIQSKKRRKGYETETGVKVNLRFNSREHAAAMKSVYVAVNMTGETIVYAV